MSTSKLIKIVIIVLGFGSAGAIFYHNTASSNATAKPSYPIDAVAPWWTCEQCNHQFELTFEELDRSRENVPAAPGGDAQLRGSGKSERVKCPKCQAFAGVVCNKCPEHGVVYRVRAPDGSRGVCPECVGRR